MEIFRKTCRIAATALLLSSATFAAQAASTLETVKARGKLICGVSMGTTGFALADAQGIEGREGVGPELDAGADLADLGGLFEHLHCQALPRQRQRRREPADAAAGDDDRIVHRCPFMAAPAAGGG